MGSKLPLVSIVIPVFNGSNYLKQAIESALSQDYQNIEIIVVNDGSIDIGATEQIALSFGNKIRYFSKENGGVATALNLAIGVMHGDYFSWLSHDDIYYSDKISKQVNYLQKIKQDVILYSDYDFIDYAGNYIKTQLNPSGKSEDFKKSLLISHPINGCTVLIPRFIFDKVGLFNESMRTTQDYDMWFRMADKYEFHHMKDILIKSRLHSEQGVNAYTELHIRECDYFFSSCLNDINTHCKFNNESEKFYYFIRCAIHASKFKRFDTARKSLNLASFYNKKYLSISFLISWIYFFYKQLKHSQNFLSIA
jgi:glycosyltransferase involved in cell wall biosynthesis